MKSGIPILSVCLALWLVGCRGGIRDVVLDNRLDSIYIERMVPLPLPPDSAHIRALMECDENGQVVLRWLDMANSKNVNLLFTLDSLGHVIADMKVRRDTLYRPGKEIYVNRETKVPYPVEKKLTRWEQWKMDLGGFAFGILAVIGTFGLSYVVKWLIRRKK